MLLQKQTNKQKKQNLFPSTPNIMSICFASLGEPISPRTASELSKCLVGIWTFLWGSSPFQPIKPVPHDCQKIC